ncbi:hypothetical protein [Halanaerobacter jeridensis]|uniref:Uncharacterized protein n=1 Tax=Halanaerobacter jeridensis TaxID=706427 RepID=A0A939BSJ5_9FIRM|nr:hypothetical protein [Halanaerobacter jeridensis]MBM7557211.1 hypothetical protein [Halanaerobacter jeridensis]
MKIYLDRDELYQTELYEHKLAVILGRGKRLKRVLQEFPTKNSFKQSSMQKIADVIGINNQESKILEQLKSLDETYEELTNPQFSKELSSYPEAQSIMCVDTEYLQSDLDSIQYAYKEADEWEVGIIFTNSDLAPAVDIQTGIKHLEDLIAQYDPDIFVGHDFSCDIRVLEDNYRKDLPALHNYDDTLDMVKKSNLENIIRGASLDDIITNIFYDDTIGLFNAYRDLDLFVEYGLKDAIYPIYAREYFMTGKLPQVKSELTIDKVVKEKAQKEISFNSILLKEDVND